MNAIIIRAYLFFIQRVSEHFRWEAGILFGQTLIGRVTIDVLRINDADCIEQRQELIDAGLFPPE